MAAEARKLLEELMGAEAMGSGPQENIHFTDKRVCRAYLCGLCPHTLFTNTKMDLGPCPKLHSDKLKEEFEHARKDRNYGIEEEFEQTLYQFVRDCDHRIESARRRLEKPATEGSAAPLLKEIADYTTEIATLTEQVEKLGEEGQVDEAMKLHAKVEEITAMKAEKEDELRQKHAQHPSNQEQKLRVCDVCAAFLSILDSDSRLADHFGGKLHMGYVAVRERLKELQDHRIASASSSSYNTDPHHHHHHRRDNSYGSSSGSRSHREHGRSSNGVSSHDYDSRRRRDYHNDRHDDRRDGGGGGSSSHSHGRSRHSRTSRDRSRSPDRSRYRDR